MALTAGHRYNRTLLDPVEQTFTLSLRAYGPKHKAVAWRDGERQLRRFQLFAGLFQDRSADDPVTINDLGCGYGAMWEAFRNLPALARGKFHGYDISVAMVRKARQLYPDPRAEFHVSHVATHQADYSLVSGTYNMKMQSDDAAWRDFVRESMLDLWSKTEKVFAFNMLSAANPRRERTLYYGEPEDYLRFCRENMSPDARLIDRFAPAEFVIFVPR